MKAKSALKVKSLTAITLRMSPAQKARYAAEANGAGLDLSNWIRARCDAEKVLTVETAPPDQASPDLPISTHENPTGELPGAHLLLFGKVGPNGSFGTALFEVTLVDAAEIIRRVGGNALASAVSSTEEVDRLRVENERLGRALGLIQMATRDLGSANGARVSIKRHDRQSVGQAAQNSTVESPPADDDPDTADVGYDVDSMLTELNGLSPARELEDPGEISEERVWKPRLTLFRQQRMWMEAEWGPQPGRDGCQAPMDMLIDMGFVR